MKEKQCKRKKECEKMNVKDKSVWEKKECGKKRLWKKKMWKIKNVKKRCERKKYVKTCEKESLCERNVGTTQRQWDNE